MSPLCALGVEGGPTQGGRQAAREGYRTGRVQRGSGLVIAPISAGGRRQPASGLRTNTKYRIVLYCIVLYCIVLGGLKSRGLITTYCGY